MSFAYFAIYTGDYLRDTRHLTPLKHGIYLLLLMHCWDQKGPLPLDEQECAGIANCRSADEIEAIRYILDRYFVKMEDGWYNKRVQKEIEKAEALSDKRRAAGLSRHGAAIPVKKTAGQTTRSARMSAARKLGTHSREEWDALVEFHGDQCAKCGSNATLMVKDHIKSIMTGGSDAIENLQPLCATCNIQKGSTESIDYRKEGWEQHVHNKCTSSAPTPTPITIPTTSTTTTTTESKTLRASRSELQALIELDVPEQTAKDWLKVRKAKRAPLTETAVNKLKAEAEKAGLSVAEAVRISAENSWQGFKAEWLQGLKSKSTGQSSPITTGWMPQELLRKTNENQ